MAGLGIADFLRHTSDENRGGGKFLDWKKDGKVDLWLHCRAPIVGSWSHQFIFADTVVDRETKKPKDILRWPRYVSPDPEPVHREQYFREDGPNSALRTRPDRDPFLLLREWLRFADDLALDQTIFEWFDPKERKQIEWNRGEISGLVKRGQQNYGHSLDTKLEYLFVVLVVGEDQLIVARESKLLGQRVGEVIRQQQDALGEEAGDPTRTPYAFRWESLGKKAKSPMDTYKAFRLPKVECDDETLAVIDSEEYPDTAQYAAPGEDDLVKVRAAFEAAARVDLPLDAIFSEDPEERAALTRPRGSARGARSSGARPGSGASAARPGAGQARPAGRPSGSAATGRAPAGRQGAPAGQAQRPAPQGEARPSGAAAKPAGAAVPAGRRKVEKPAPVEEMIGCDDCGELLAVTATVCPKCGATYANDDAPPVIDQGGERDGDEPSTADGPDDLPEALKCWSCSGEIREGICANCGIEQSDDLPYP